MPHYELSIELSGNPTRKKLCVDSEEPPEDGDELQYQEGGKTITVAVPNGVGMTIPDECSGNWGEKATLVKKSKAKKA